MIMEELTIEQKAERYDKALANAKYYHSEMEGDVCCVLEECFSELKESNDENIKSCIGVILTDANETRFNDFHTTLADCLVWLEKQDTFSKKDVNDAYLKGITDTKNEIEKQYEASYQIRKDIATFIFNYRGDIKDRAKWMNYLGIKVSFAEKQDEQKHNIHPKFKIGDIIRFKGNETLKGEVEAHKIVGYDNESYVFADGTTDLFCEQDLYELVEQKSADKVKPKFKVGDFVADTYCRGKIIAVTSDSYLLDTEQGIPFSCEDKIHLWTIEDAKDGDVLFSLDSSQPFIYQERKPHEQATAYCGINIYGKFFVWNTEDCIITLDRYIPATKEQRDTLVKAMTDAGYTFDFDKKELKKIEQSKLTKFEDAVKDMMDDYKDAIGDNDATTEEVKKHAAYLLSLIPCKPSEWSEEDKGILLDIKCVIDNIWHSTSVIDTGGYSEEELKEMWEWLDKIWQRVEYHEEKQDEQMVLA